MEALKQYNREEEEEKLFGFILHMSDQEEVFIDWAQKQGYRLDENQSMDSLEELERYAREKSIDFQMESDEAVLERMNCWYYLGEAVRKQFGGEWHFSMSKENSMHWGAYVIEGHCPVPGVEFEPLGLFKRFCRQGYKSGMLRRAINVQVNPQRKDWNGIPSEEPETAS
jgi:hypothetical protein